MDAARAKRIERNVERGASALFAGAIGFAAYRYWSPTVAQPTFDAYLAALGVTAYALSKLALGSLAPPRPRYPVPVFDLRKIDPASPEELLLTDVVPAAHPVASGEPVVLDDILAELPPDSRVVQLFDPSAMPTPGQLNARIEHHLGWDAPPAPSPDASEALFDALAELRRSLR